MEVCKVGKTPHWERAGPARSLISPIPPSPNTNTWQHRQFINHAPLLQARKALQKKPYSTTLKSSPHPLRLHQTGERSGLYPYHHTPTLGANWDCGGGKRKLVNCGTKGFRAWQLVCTPRPGGTLQPGLPVVWRMDPMSGPPSPAASGYRAGPSDC